jgi:spore coat polysaccharide biosynthesis protein SpsF (cytidylyltransferase family)
MTTACIVQARLGSTRLPAKVLLPLPTGRTVLEEVLFRCRQIPGVDVVVCAIPDTRENYILAEHVIRSERMEAPSERFNKIVLFRGSEHDVLARYAGAAAVVNADIVMRVTSDCPLIDPEVCGKILDLHRRINVGYVSNCWPTRTYPQGFDCEVFNREILERANSEAADPYDREHVTPWMQRQPDIEWATLATEEDRSHLRWTLDTLEDYTRIWNVFQEQQL